MVTDTIQIALQETDFSPVPGGADHYVAAIQNKSGELKALRRASPETWSRLTPLMEIVGRKRAPTQYRREAVAGWVKRVAAAVGEGSVCVQLIHRLLSE